MKPIGILKSVFQSKNGTPRQSGLCSFAKGSLTVDKSVFNNPEHSLEGLQDFSHVWLLFVFHKNNNAHSKAKVKPPRLNGGSTGVFSTRSPYRPNAIGLTLAKIDSIEGATIHLTGIDMIDGTPILDIKPYIPNDQPVSSLTSAPVIPDGAEKQSSSQPHTFADNQSVDSLTSSMPRNDVGDSAMDTRTTLLLKHSVDCSSLDSKTNSSKDTMPLLDKTLPLLSDSVNSLNMPEEVMVSSTEECPPPISSCKHKIDNCGDGYDSDIKMSISACKHEDDNCSDGDIKMSNSACKHDDNCSDIKMSISACKHDDNCSDGDIKMSISACKHGDGDIKMSRTQNSSSESTNITTANWVINPLVSKLDVHFTNFAQEQLEHFSSLASDDQFKLIHLQNVADLQSAIKEILHEDPRSVYRRKQCPDSLYYFTVDSAHITCWFDGNRAEVIRVQPKALVPQCS